MTACVSLFGSNQLLLEERLRVLATRRRIVELRVDRIEGLDWSALARASGNLKVVLAAVPKDQGGEFEGNLAEWTAVIEPIAAEFGERAIIDFPPSVSSAPESLSAYRRVWSWHEERGDSSTDLGRVFEQLQAKAEPRDYIKIVAWAERHDEAMRTVHLLNHVGDGRLIAFAQGPGGRATRLWAPVLGAPWTYASWAGEVTAPGQWSEDELPRDEDWAEMQCFGVFGDPVEHSRSPELWQTAFRWAALECELEGKSGPPLRSYLRLQHASLREFAELYQAPCFRAFSVTAPLKDDALKSACKMDALAQQVGASNLLYRDDDGVWCAGQSDGEGALRPMREAGLDPAAPILILGAGGAARAVVEAALAEGREVTVAARRIEQAQDLAAGRPAVRATTLREPNLTTVARRSHRSLGVVQATPVGSTARPGNLLVDHSLQAGDYALDMVYAPLQTEFLRAAKEQGAVAIAGHRMLLAQMLRQCELTLGCAPPSELLQLTLEASLGFPQAPIVLCGPRASGKSTLGAMLARVLDWPFLDADACLEERTGRTIREWIAADEAGFRKAEAALLAELIELPQHVIALGGGAVEDAESLALLAAHPRVLGLSLSPAEQLARRQVGDDRPALTEFDLGDEIRVLDERRFPLYEKACAGRWVNVGGNKAESFQCLFARLKLLV